MEIKVIQEQFKKCIQIKIYGRVNLFGLGFSGLGVFNQKAKINYLS